MRCPWFSDDLQYDPAALLDPGNKLAGVTTVGPDQRDRGHRHARVVEDAAPTVAVLHAGRGDQHDDQPAQGVHDDVALAAVDLLAGVIAAAGGADRVGTSDPFAAPDRGCDPVSLRPGRRVRLFSDSMSSMSSATRDDSASSSGAMCSALTRASSASRPERVSR